MKQLTQNEFKKGAKNYKNIASPEQDIEHEQIKFMAIDEFGNLQYSQDGENYETIQSDGKIKPLTSLTPIASVEDLPEGQEGDAYAVLTNGNLPLMYYVYTTEWENRGQFVDNTLVYANDLLYIYNSTFAGYFKSTCYTRVSQLTNDANYVNEEQLLAVENKADTNADNIADIQANYVTTDTNQEISGTKTYVGSQVLRAKINSEANNYFYVKPDGNGLNAKLGFISDNLMLSNAYVYSMKPFIPSGNQLDLGLSGTRWRHLYLSGVLSDGTNSISVADIANKNNVGFPIIPTPSSATLTNDEAEAIRSGGVVKGNINGLGNFQNYVFFPAGELFSGYYMGFVVVSRNGYSKLYQYAINDSTNLITFYGNKNIDIDSASNISITGLNNINGKTLPAYPSNTGSFIFKSVDGALSWDADNYLTTDTAQNITGEKTFVDTDIALKNSNASGNASWQLEEDVYGQLTASRTYNNIKSKMMEFNGNSIKPVGNNGNLGSTSQKWQNLYLNGNITDGTNSVSVSDIADAQTDIADIESKIPAQASSSNQLADKDFVNSSINALAAYYITKNAQGDPFATKAELNNATTFYSGGSVRVPTTNDYCIVLADESQQSSTGVAPTTRYSYQGGQWEFQYKINDTPLTAAQLSALNSGITSTLVGQIGTNQTNIASLSTDKADKTYVDGNFVSVNAQTLTDAQKAQARANIGAGSASATTVLVNGVAQNSVSFDSNPQTQIDGKQATIDSTHKLSADLTEDGTTNKVFTATEQTKLSGIESGAEVNDVTDVQVNGTSILSSKVANIVTNTAYDATTNKIATMSDIPAPITVDSSMSTTSTNPVQNKIVTEAFKNYASQTQITINGRTRAYLYVESYKKDYLITTSDGDVILYSGINETPQCMVIEKGTDSCFELLERTSNNEYLYLVFYNSNSLGKTISVYVDQLTKTDGNDKISLTRVFSAPTNTIAISKWLIVDTSHAQTLSNKTFAGVNNTGDYKIGSSNSTIASVSGTNLTLGNSSLATNIAGSGTRPTYNSNSLALYNDLNNKVSQVTTNYIAYGTDGSGNQYSLPYDDTYATQSTLVMRNLNGRIIINSPDLSTTYSGSGLVGINYTALTQYVSKTLLDSVYPVGSVYMSIENTSPASFLGGTWTSLGSGRALWLAPDGYAGTTINAGLPNISGDVTCSIPWSGASGATTSALYTTSTRANYCNGSSGQDIINHIYFNATRSNSIYGNSSTVQPPAYQVYGWRRTA